MLVLVEWTLQDWWCHRDKLRLGSKRGQQRPWWRCRLGGKWRPRDEWIMVRGWSLAPSGRAGVSSKRPGINWGKGEISLTVEWPGYWRCQDRGTLTKGIGWSGAELAWAYKTSHGGCKLQRHGVTSVLWSPEDLGWVQDVGYWAFNNCLIWGFLWYDCNCVLILPSRNKKVRNSSFGFCFILFWSHRNPQHRDFEVLKW